MNKSSVETDKSDNWWEYNISEQFPIKYVIETNGPTYIEVDKPHEGCFIRTTMKNGKMNGESSIHSKFNTLMATLTFVDGIASGPCTLCKNGILFYKGFFVNGYREGRGQEYDENGNVVFDGYYKKGKKLNIVPSNEMGKGYWKELDENGRIIRISQKDELGNREGFCYFYEDGKISRVSVWREGKEVKLLKQFYDDKMIEYKNGKKVYEGGFVDSLEMGYPRKDKCSKFGNGENISVWEDKFKSNTIYSKTARLYGTLVENRFVTVTVAVVSMILFYFYFFVIYLNNGPHGIKFEQESYNASSGSGKYLRKFVMSNYPNLRRIEIGDECFGSVKTFKIDGLNRLKTIKVGINSFTQLKKAEWQKISNDERVKRSSNSKSFHILNCASLESIEIGDFSFSDFGGDFELKNLPLLQSIQIGSKRGWSSNFYLGSFLIRGIDMIFNICND